MSSLCSGRRQDAMEKLKATQQVAPSAAFRGDFTTLRLYKGNSVYWVGCTDCRCLLFKHSIQIDCKYYSILCFFGIGINKKQML